VNLKECKGNQTTHHCNWKLMIQKASDPLGPGPLATKDALLRLLQDQITEQQQGYILIIKTEL